MRRTATRQRDRTLTGARQTAKGETNYPGGNLLRPAIGGPQSAIVWLLTAIIVAAVLTPGVSVSSRLPDIRAEQILAAPALLWLVAGARRGRSNLRGGALGLIDLAFLALAAASLISILYAPLALKEAFSPKDGYEVIKLAIYWVLFRFGLAAGADRTARRAALTSLFAAGSLSALFALAQYFDWLGVAGRMGSWWAPAHHLRALERDGRAFGTVGNPNYFGALMTLVAVTAFTAILRPSPGAPWDRWAAGSGLAFGVLGVVLSGSRGAMATLAVAVITSSAVALAARYPCRRLAGALALLAAAFVAAVVLVELFPRGRVDYLTRVAGVLSPTSDNALALRLERWRGLAGRFAPSPSGDARNYLRNGDLEEGEGERAAGFRTLPGTVYRRAPDAARSGAYGIVYRGNPESPAKRAAVYQQRHLGRPGGAPLTASVWVKLPGPARGEVFLYTNVLYANGERQDPYARVAADGALSGVWQQLSITITPQPGRQVDFLGVYLLSDDFTGEVHADEFALVDTGVPPGGAGGPEVTGSAGLGLDAGAQFRRSPVFGVGPGKAAGAAVVDNEYLLVAARYGVVGLAAYLFVWAAALLMAVRRARSRPVAAAIAGVVLGLLVFNLVAGSLYHLQLMGVFWPLAGLALAGRRSEA